MDSQCRACVQGPGSSRCSWHRCCCESLTYCCRRCQFDVTCVFNRFPPVGFVEQHNVASRPPDVESECTKRGIWVDDLQLLEQLRRGPENSRCSYLVVTIEIKIFFGLQRLRIGLFWCRLYAFSHVGKDFLRPQHSICIETCISGRLSNNVPKVWVKCYIPVRTRNTWEKALKRLQYE